MNRQARLFFFVVLTLLVGLSLISVTAQPSTAQTLGTLPPIGGGLASTAKPPQPTATKAAAPIKAATKAAQPQACVPNTPDATKSTLLPATQSVTNDLTQATLTVQVKDCNGANVNIAGGVPIQINVNGFQPVQATIPNGVTFNPSFSGSNPGFFLPANTNNTGQFSFSVASFAPVTNITGALSQIGFQLLVNTGSGLAPSATAVVNFTQTPPTVNTINASPNSVPGDGSTTSTLTLSYTYTDKSAGVHAWVGQTVTLTASSAVIWNGSGPASTTSPALVTDTNGQITVTVAKVIPDNNPVTVTFTPSVNPSTVNAQVQFTPPVIDANKSTLVLTVPNGASYTLSSIPADGTINSEAIVTVVAKDKNGNVLQNYPVTLSTAGLTVITSASPVNTDATGTAQFTVRSINVGTVTIGAQINGVSVNNLTPNPANAQFVQAPVSPGNSSITPPSATIDADSATGQNITVTVKDTGGNPIKGISVNLSFSGAGCSVSVNNAGLTDINGQRVLNVNCGPTTVNVPVTFTAVIGGITFNTLTSTITFTPPIPVASKSTVTRNPQFGTIVGDATNSVQITVTINDAQGNPVQGIAVALVSDTPTKVTITPPASQITGANGQVIYAAVGDASKGAFTATFTGSFTFNAVSTNITQTVQVSFTVPPANQAQSTVNVTAPGPVNNQVTIINDNFTTATVVVTLKDVHGDTLPGKAVSLTLSQTAGVSVNGQTPGSVAAQVTTGAAGTATFLIKSSQVYSNPGIVVTATDVTDTPNVTGIAGTPPATIFVVAAKADPNFSTVQVQNNPQPANGTSAITLVFTLKDSQQNLVSSKLVRLRSSATPPNTPCPASQTGVVIGPNAVVDNCGNPIVATTNGVATFTVTSTTVYNNTLQLYLDDITDSIAPFLPQNVNIPTLTFTAAAGGATVSAANSTIFVVPNSVGSGVNATVTVTLRDATNTPIVGRAISDVTLATSSLATLTSLGITVTPIGASSDASGNLQWTISNGAAAGPFTLWGVEAQDSQIIKNPPAGQSNIITFTGPTPTPIPTNTSTPIVANTTQTLTAIAASQTAVAMTQTSAALTQTVVALTQTSTSTPSGGSTSVPTPVGGGSCSPVTSTIQVFPSSIPADGFTPATIVVTARNSSGTTLPSVVVSLNFLVNGVAGSLPASASLSPASGSATTQANGTAAFTITDSATDVISFTANCQGVTISAVPSGGTRTVTFVQPQNPNSISPILSTISANPGTVAADGTSISIITVTIRTVSGGVPNTTTQVTLGSSNAIAGTVIVSPSTTQIADITTGTATFQVRSATVQNVVFLALATNYLGSVILANSTSVNFVSPSSLTQTPSSGTPVSGGIPTASNSTLTTDYVSIPADGTFAATLTATLKNASGGVVPGKQVNITASQALSGMTVTAVNSVTDSTGQAKFQVKSTVVGSATFSASDVTDSPTVFITQTVTITFTAKGTQPVASSTTTTGTTVGTQATGPVIGTVLAYLLNVRTGPSLDAKILGLLARRTRVLVLAKNFNGRWYNIQLKDRTAWVYSAYIRLSGGRADFARLPVVPETPPLPPDLIPVDQGITTSVIPVGGTTGPGVGVVTTATLYVRKGPGLEYDQVGILSYGTEMNLIGQSADRQWYEISTNDGPRWVYAYFVRIKSLQGSGLPVVAAPPK